MSSDVVISARGLSKSYRLFDHPGDRIKQFLSLGLRRYHREFTALQDVSFDIRRGETIGIIGRNGSGKSTLLQLICGILKPTAGTALVYTGFNILILVAALALTDNLSAGLLLVPLLILPALLLGIGADWFLAAWGVFIKDMTQIMPLLVQMLLFLSPVFYPASAAPPGLPFLYNTNPLGAVIEAVHPYLPPEKT